MKKISQLICLMLSIAILTACSSSLASTSPNNSTAFIQVVNNSGKKIQSVELHPEQSVTQLSAQGLANADGSAFKKGDILSFELRSSELDFNQPVTIELIVEVDNVKLSAGTVQSIQLS